LEQSVDIQVFPNPVSDFLNIDIETSEAFELSGAVFKHLGAVATSIPD
jgi:hypothetical protein